MNTRTNRMKNSLLKLLAWLYPASLFDKMGYYATVFRSYKIASKLKACGRGTRFGEVEFLTGHRHICVGEDTVFLSHLFLTSWGADDDSTKISIGNHCSIGAYCHISAYKGVTIGDNVLMGKWVSIVDNDHGKMDRETLELPPLKRELVSKGPIVIGDSVWIGDKVTILSGVTIGCHAVIAANAVVTKDVPAYSVVAGNPGRVVKKV